MVQQSLPSRRVARWHTGLDVVIAGLPLLIVTTAPLGVPDRAPGQGLQSLVVCGLLVAFALVLRRRRPMTALVACLCISVIAMLLFRSPTALDVAVVVALFSVAVNRPVRVAAVSWTGCAVVRLAADLATGGWDQRVLAALSLMAASTAVGVAVAKQREVLGDARERAVVAERTREEEAARRVTAERLRIARELHDVVAHHVAVMGVHAGVASHFLDVDAERARAAMTQVRASGRTAVTELGAVVGLLREPGDEQLVAPAPSLVQLPALVDTMRRSGLVVRWHGHDDVGSDVASEERLDEMSDITAYRIVQEAFTNALRHGSGTVDLVVMHTPGAVRIRISNPVVAGHAARSDTRLVGSGHGLVGMRERAALVGADVFAGLTSGGQFEVRAELPVRPRVAL